MASQITGYEYDIFISYRQKDNKYDGWVSEFVDNLKKELDATFKEEISVYFDINPHDGLLETHDVGESLRKKLKCLIFIPIISRTYCDPKSFAWEHEFKAFVEQSSQDQFGLKVRLISGNVGNRVLPVRIHDLETTDIKECESVTGGFLRGVEFIYKSPGVNRSLRAKEDNPYDNLNHTFYRDQINKVALAVRDIIESMKSTAAEDKLKEKEFQTEKKVEKKVILSGETVLVEKREKKLKSDKLKRETVKRLRYLPLKVKVLALSIPITLAILILTILNINHRAKVKWATEKALTDIEKFFDGSNYIEAFNMAAKAKRFIPESPELKDWLSKVVAKLTVLTDPPGADVYIKEYSDTSGIWNKLGLTPLDSIKVPVSTFYRFKIEKSGYETVFAVTRTGIDTLSRKLFEQGTIPPGMVYVDGYYDEVKNSFDTKNGFFLDKYEITNKQYKEFIDNGGYRNREYWKNEFIKEGKKLSWEESMSEFTDKTGRPGPSTWEAGDYPDGQDNYPVTGLSWYEASAYAEFAGKELPTADHWDSGAGFYNILIFSTFSPEIFPLSNFSPKGPAPVGHISNISCYGAFDMAGNVREWNWNETGFGRIISGGGWSDENYMFLEWGQMPSFDRSPMNGFRCVKYLDKEKIPVTAFRLIEMAPRGNADYSLETPVPENIFRIYKNQFLYDKTALNPIIEDRDESHKDWIVEKISLNAAYENDRMMVYLFLPRNSSPPFQTLIFFPGSYAIESKELGPGTSVNSYLDFILKSGRAAAYPVYFRTYERNDGKNDYYPAETHQYTEVLIKWVKDFSRTIDYLETRSDIDTSRLGFYGHSWGGRLGGIIPAVENRLAVNILVLGGLSNTKPFPEADGINYVPRIKIPTLMLNGRYDSSFPIKKSLMPFFNNLGTPEADKRLVIYETGHYVTKSDRTREILSWCDKYLGPVK
jgi:eukaryotic-like serine/threonine-protein kinase